jgi:TolB protein
LTTETMTHDRLGQKMVHHLQYLFFGLGLLLLAIQPARALVEIDIRGGNIEPLPIALPAFSAEGGDSKLAADMTNVIAADLKRSGLFNPLDPAGFLQKNMSVNSTPRFGDWRQIRAQALVTGTVIKQPDGRLRAEFRLWDVFAAEQMLGQQFYTTPENWRRLAHIIADAIYERLTGEKG